MRYERLLTHKASVLAPYGRHSQFGRLWQLVVLLYALLATLALWTLVQAPAGIQHLLLLCLLRLAVLLCVCALSYQAHHRRRAEAGASPPTSRLAASAPAPPTAAGSNPATPRTTLARAVLYLQLAWLSSEVLLGSALLLFYPAFLGPLASDGGSGATATATLLTLLPLACAVAMSGCFLFLQRLASRRRRSGPNGGSPCGLECGASSRFASLAALRNSSSQCFTAASGDAEPCLCSGGMTASNCLRHSSVDVVCSPSSDDELCSFSSAASSATSSAAFYARSSCSSLGLSGGMPSPTGHVRGRSSGAEAAAAAHEAVVQAACQILLVEHQLDTNEYCLFVHKKLRPIKTRPEDKISPPSEQPGLLRDLITNSFTFQRDPQLAGQLASHLQQGKGGPNSGVTSSGSSLTFQTAPAPLSRMLAV